MIEYLSLQNFQAHSKFQVKLDPHITVIVGPSDAGKSSIIRALYWVAFNHPSGISFIKDGSKGSCVTVKTNKDTIKRRRSKTINHYEINGTKLEALKRGEVPGRVENALRLNKINFQLQHDSPLWLSESAGQVAKNLNEIVNLELIDAVLTTLSRQLRSSMSEASVCFSRLEKARSDKAKLEWVSEAEEALIELEELEKELEQVQREETQLLAICTPLLSAVKAIKSIQSVIDPITTELTAIEEYEGKITGTSKSINRLTTQITELEEAEKFVSEAAAVLSGLEQDIKVVEDVLNKGTKSKQLLSSLEPLVNQMVRLNDEVTTTQKELTEAEVELSKVKTCPVCGKDLG